MLGTRHEEYKHFTDGLPFVLNANIIRTKLNLSAENNWHENLEIQICNEGSGTMLLDGQKITFEKGDIIVVNSDVIHYTGTDDFLNYSCLIIDTDFCKQIGIDTRFLSFAPLIHSSALSGLINTLAELYYDPNISCRIAKLNKTLLEILIELSEHHTVNIAPHHENKKYETVKQTISYIRANYSRKLTLDEISKAVLYDKYALCREFRKLTGQTVIENLNNYRCIKAIDCLTEGHSVAVTASLCGFDNPSFFTRTFKKHFHKLPSEYRRESLNS